MLLHYAPHHPHGLVCLLLHGIDGSRSLTSLCFACGLQSIALRSSLLQSWMPQGIMSCCTKRSPSLPPSLPPREPDMQSVSSVRYDILPAFPAFGCPGFVHTKWITMTAGLCECQHWHHSLCCFTFASTTSTCCLIFRPGCLICDMDFISQWSCALVLTDCASRLIVRCGTSGLRIPKISTLQSSTSLLQQVAVLQLEECTCFMAMLLRPHMTRSYLMGTLLHVLTGACMTYQHLRKAAVGFLDGFTLTWSCCASSR